MAHQDLRAGIFGKASRLCDGIQKRHVACGLNRNWILDRPDDIDRPASVLYNRNRDDWVYKQLLVHQSGGAFGSPDDD